MLAFSSKEDIVQNLIDAGCKDDLIASFTMCFEAGKIKEALTLLSVHRNELLKKSHAIQEKISCLDYLCFQINKADVERGIINE